MGEEHWEFWDNHREYPSGPINLKSAFEAQYGLLPQEVADYLNAIEKMQIIRSRQTASVAIITAAVLFAPGKAKH